jgi:hypothetical protein
MRKGVHSKSPRSNEPAGKSSVNTVIVRSPKISRKPTVSQRSTP